MIFIFLRINVDALLANFSWRGRRFGVITRTQNLDTDLQISLQSRKRNRIHWVKTNTAGLDHYALRERGESVREHLGSSRGVIGVSQKQPLVNEAVLRFIVDHPEVKLERANQSVRNHLLCIEQLYFSQTVKHLVRTLTKVEKQNL